ncbi:putative zinc finger protein [Apostichopus japonicus]|uniref:Putative zinc finger protein n=1 Tax=Stichopus japonicus TaxID=307972 RepID=A0A2G8KA24_STIJA|nr:putative zinc finger protein [Apostichopus japonicus]
MEMGKEIRDFDISIGMETNVTTTIDYDQGEEGEDISDPRNEETIAAVPISIGSMSDAIQDMLSPSALVTEETVPTISISAPADELDLDSINPKAQERIAQLKALKDQQYLERYNRKVKNRKITFMLCEICGAAVCNKSFKRHIEAVHYKGQREGLFACSICNKKFLYPTNVKRHELIHANARFHCRYCENTYAQEGACRSHERKCHSSEDPKTEDTKMTVTKMTKLTAWPHYKSADRATKIVECQVCKKKMKRSSLRHHMETHNPEGVSCPICHKVYSSTCSLRTHTQTHGKEEVPLHCVRPVMTLKKQYLRCIVDQ